MRTIHGLYSPACLSLVYIRTSLDIVVLVLAPLRCNDRKSFSFSETNFNDDLVTKGYMCIFGYGFLRFSTPPYRESEGTLPLKPRGLSLLFPEKAAKKQHPLKMLLSPHTLCAVQVAPQRCPIPHIDKHFYYNLLLESIQALRKLLIDKNAKKKDLRLSNGMSTMPHQAGP